MAQPFVIIEQIIIVLLAGIIVAKLSERFGVPSVIPLFICGYLIGPEVLGIFAPLELGLSLSVLATFAIPVILFDEGMRIDLKLLNEFKFTIFLLATLAVVISTVGVGLTAYVVFGFPLLAALLLGAIVAATSPAAAVSVMRRLEIGKKISTIIEAEASFNDATSIVLFVIISGAMMGAGISVPDGIFSFVKLFFGGLVIGSLISFFLQFVRNRFGMQEYGVYLSLLNFLCVYLVAELLTTSGATAVVAAGLVQGRATKSTGGNLSQEKVLDFWSDLGFLARSIIFLVLGAGFSVALLGSVWLEAVIITVLLFTVIRPISVFAATRFERKLTVNEKLFLSWIGARGAVPAALAASAIGLGISGAVQIFHVVIVVVLASLVIVGLTARYMAKKTLTSTYSSQKYD